MDNTNNTTDLTDITDTTATTAVWGSDYAPTGKRPCYIAKDRESRRHIYAKLQDPSINKHTLRNTLLWDFIMMTAVNGSDILQLRYTDVFNKDDSVKEFITMNTNNSSRQPKKLFEVFERRLNFR